MADQLKKGALSSEMKSQLIRKERRSNNAFHKFVRNKSASIGFIIVAVLIICGAFAPLLATHDPNQLDVLNSYLRPFSPGHFLGTDALGRDLYSRLLYGARMSIIVALGSTILGGICGILLGLIAGYFGGMIDAVIMRIMDGLFAFPFILLSILLVTILGSGVFNVILAIGIGTIPRFARIIRSKVITVKNEEFCNAERVIGASPARIMFLHILPNTISEVIVYATLSIGNAIISEASLSFLGLGILIPTPSWGNILREGRSCLASAPHIANIAGILIIIAVVGFNLTGDGIRDVLDPKMKK